MAKPHRRQIVWLLTAAMLLPIIVVVGLAARILRQDRDAERQRRDEQLRVAALGLALDLDRRLQEVEDRLTRGDGMRLSPAGPVSTPELPLLYRSSAALPSLAPTSTFRDAETAEHQRRDLDGAAAIYRAFTRSPHDDVRASALLGLAAVLRKKGDRPGALEAYADLETLGHVLVAGQPAALLAREGRCRLFEETGEAPRLRQEAEAFSRALMQGGWPIDRAAFENYQDNVRRWGAVTAPASAIAKTDAALRIWEEWRDGTLALRGRKLVRSSSGQVLALWQPGPDLPVAWLLTSDELDAWVRPLSKTRGVQALGQDGDGERLFGTPATGAINLAQNETRLPFILTVAPHDGTFEAGDSMRRAILVGSLAAALALMLAAGYGLYRTTTRELMLARQQADFVSSVSHEFRTPLTSMRHLTDLLANRAVATEERRMHYYGLLSRETERLHRMVEGLLSFGRIEAGAYAWRLEPLDPSGILHTVVDEFRRDSQAAGREIRVEVGSDLPQIKADAEALSRALWNLLENAAKYSPAGSPIVVRAVREDGTILISVVDRGAGIPLDEQRSIFDKFVRGTDATQAGINGVGIGLALVRRIVEAHGGGVRVKSQPGSGSTFVVSLPVAGDASTNVPLTTIPARR